MTQQFTRITNPTTIESALLHRNKVYFAQAKDTPLIHPTVTSQLPFTANSLLAELILAGNADVSTLTSNPHAQALLQSCKQEAPTSEFTLHKKHVTQQCKVWNEHTSTSAMSGPCLGHMKCLVRPPPQKTFSPKTRKPPAILHQAQRSPVPSRHLPAGAPIPPTTSSRILHSPKESKLPLISVTTDIHTNMLKMTIQHMYCYERWKDVVTMMIEKDPGRPKIH
jgi:hypothetical protein